MITATSEHVCERHALIGVECSGPAEFILRRHDKTHYICRAFAQHIWTIGRTLCYDCRRRIVDHWDTEPIR